MTETVIIWALAAGAFIVLALLRTTPRRRAAESRYCTKHVRHGTYGPLVPASGGRHRTPGPACDGPEHHAVPVWW